MPFLVWQRYWPGRTQPCQGLGLGTQLVFARAKCNPLLHVAITCHHFDPEQDLRVV